MVARGNALLRSLFAKYLPSRFLSVARLFGVGGGLLLKNFRDARRIAGGLLADAKTLAWCFSPL